MAGVGVKLNRIFEKKSIAADLVGFVYSVVITIAPMIVIIANILLIGWKLGFNEEAYLTRELFSCTILYTFIFALLVVAPFNAVLSLGAFCGRGRGLLCIYRILCLYFHDTGILFHGISVHL